MLETIGTIAYWSALGVAAYVLITKWHVLAYRVAFHISSGWHDGQLQAMDEAGMIARAQTTEDIINAQTLQMQEAGLVVCQYDDETDSYQPIERSH